MTGKAIVVGYDGSTGSQAALRWAVGEARMRRSPLRLVYAAPAMVQLVPPFGGYVLPDLDARREAGQVTLAAGAATAADLAPEVQVDTELTDTTPTVALLSGSADDEMVVVGSRGLGGFSDLLVGSTSVQLATHASCPVVVIRPAEPHPGGPGLDAGRIVVGVDGSDVSTEALGFAFEEASMRGVGLTALHAWQSAYFDAPGRGAPVLGSVVAEEFQASEMRVLAESISLWTEKLPSVSLAQRVVHGDPVTTLVEASAGAELLVVGSRGRDGFRSLLLGSVSHAVLHHAHCPVTVVRHHA
jgi:nucleotide-binding universal stress UspA family protein